MTTILRILTAVTLFCALCAITANAQTNAGVTLTPSQIAALNGGVDSLLPLIPASDQAIAIKIIALLGLLAGAGRIVEGYRTGGIGGVFHALFTSRNATGAPVSGYPSKTGQALSLLAILGLSAFLFTGCANRQMISNHAIHGFNATVTVPVPFSGGESLLKLGLEGGVIQDNEIVQSTSTNRLYTSSVVIYQASHGAIGLNGNAGTNNGAGINDVQTDKNIIDTSHGTIDSTNGDEHINVPLAPFLLSGSSTNK